MNIEGVVFWRTMWACILGLGISVPVWMAESQGAVRLSPLAAVYLTVLSLIGIVNGARLLFLLTQRLRLPR